MPKAYYFLPFSNPPICFKQPLEYDRMAVFQIYKFEFFKIQNYFLMQSGNANSNLTQCRIIFLLYGAFYKNGQPHTQERHEFSPSEKALQLPNSIFEGEGRGKVTLSQKTDIQLKVMHGLGLQIGLNSNPVSAIYYYYLLLIAVYLLLPWKNNENFLCSRFLSVNWHLILFHKINT